MPTDVYECSHCPDQFVVQQRITVDPLKTCRCGSTGTVNRVIQPVGVMFKGSGFHINDYGAKPAATESSTPATGAKPEAAPAATPADCTGNPSSCACSTPE